MKQINIKDAANLDANTLNSLTFYEQDICLLKKTLDEIASKNTAHDVSEDINHFQKQIIIHAEKIDELKHAFHSNLNALEAQILEIPSYAGEDSLKANEQLFNEYHTEETVLNQMRQEFFRFAAKWV